MQKAPPEPTNGEPESPKKNVSRSRRTRSMRRGTAEISTSSLPDPHFQKDTIESTQSSLEQDFNSLYNLAQVNIQALPFLFTILDDFKHFPGI